MEGHFKNKIIKLEAVLSKRREYDDFFTSLGDEMLKQILFELDMRVDRNGVLNLRFDKQKALQGQKVLLRRGRDVISVRAKAKVHRGDREEAIEHIGKYFEKLLKHG